MNFARAAASVTAVELSDRSLELARRRASVFGLEDRIRFYGGNAEELTRFVPVEPYDLVYSFGVIHHTPRPEKVLEQIRPYMTSSSTLKVMVYHRWSWKVLWILLTYGRGSFWRLEELIARHSEAQTGCPVTYTYSKSQIRRLFSRLGFRIFNLRVDHIFPYRIADYVRYRYVRDWWCRPIPPRMFRALERAFGWHLCVEAGTA
jgi:SAM-dependent methyltransferase